MQPHAYKPTASDSRCLKNQTSDGRYPLRLYVTAKNARKAARALDRALTRLERVAFWLHRRRRGIVEDLPEQLWVDATRAGQHITDLRGRIGQR